MQHNFLSCQHHVIVGARLQTTSTPHLPYHFFKVPRFKPLTPSPSLYKTSSIPTCTRSLYLSFTPSIIQFFDTKFNPPQSQHVCHAYSRPSRSGFCHLSLHATNKRNLGCSTYPGSHPCMFAIIASNFNTDYIIARHSRTELHSHLGSYRTLN